MKTTTMIIGAALIVAGGLATYKYVVKAGQPSSPALDKLQAQKSDSLVNAWYMTGADERQLFDLYVVQANNAQTAADLASADRALVSNVLAMKVNHGTSPGSIDPREVVGSALLSSFSQKRAALAPPPQIAPAQPV